MSSILNDGSVVHGPIHECPSLVIGAPYFFGVACNDILVLWHAPTKANIHPQDGWATTRYHYESVIPSLPVLFDPFHRYYSLYNNSTIEVKDLNGNLLEKFTTDIKQATRFEFLDQYRTLKIFIIPITTNDDRKF